MIERQQRGPESAAAADRAVEVLPVRFATSNPFVPADLRPGRRQRPAKPPLECVATLYKPAAPGGAGPAVVVAHGLGGPTPEREHRYGARLAEMGCVALVIDSFTTRGVGGSGELWRALRVTTAMMMADAYAALDFLVGLPEVRADSVAIIGFSYGGMVSVLCSYEQMHERFGPASKARFSGHASYYGCSIPRLERTATTGAPVLMLLGGRDRNVSVERSEAIAVDLRAGGSPVDFRLYPDAYHQWDGADYEKRHISFSLRECRIRILPDGTLLDEKTGGSFDNFLSRFGFLGRHVSFKGYDTLRDEAVLASSDTALSGLLGRLGMGEVPPPAKVGASSAA